MNNQTPFNIAGNDKVPAGRPAYESDTSLDIKERIKNLISSCPVFLFMKGQPGMPQCGFSANVVNILNSLGVEYRTFDILSDEDIRQGVKEFSRWPTYPQLYADTKLVGGNDIVTELYETGELKAVLGLD